MQSSENSRQAGTVIDSIVDDPRSSQHSEEPLRVPSNVLLAAAVVMSKDEQRYMLNGVHVHATKDGKNLRIVSTDGKRLFVAELDYREMPIPKWLNETGIIISGANLPKRVSLLVEEVDQVVISPDPERKDMFLVTDTLETMVFRVERIDGKYPNYMQVMNNCFSNGYVPELANYVIDAGYLKDATLVAKSLYSTVQVDPSIRTYVPPMSEDGATAGSPILFGFPHIPGAYLYIMPQRVDTLLHAKADIAILGEQLRCRLIGLKTTRSALEKKLKSKISAAERTFVEEKFADVDGRIKELAATLKGGERALMVSPERPAAEKAKAKTAEKAKSAAKKKTAAKKEPKKPKPEPAAKAEPGAAKAEPTKDSAPEA